MTPSTNNGSAEQQLAPPSLDRRESSGLAGTPHEGAPGPTDVICARGKRALEHAGNQRFRRLVASNLDAYSKAQTKLEKSLLVSHIVDQVRKTTPAGGFLRPAAEGGNHHNDCGGWVEVGDGVAREKIGQAFRDALHTQYRSSTKAKRKRRQNLHGSTCSSNSSGSVISIATATNNRGSHAVSNRGSTLSRGSTKASFCSSRMNVPLQPQDDPAPLLSLTTAAAAQMEPLGDSSITTTMGENHGIPQDGLMMMERAASAAASSLQARVEPVEPPTKFRRLHDSEPLAAAVDHVPTFHEVAQALQTDTTDHDDDDDDHHHPDSDSQALLRLKRDSLFQKRDSLFGGPAPQPPQHRRASRNLSVLSYNSGASEILKNIAALKTMLSPSDLDLDHDNENDHGNNVTVEDPALFQAQQQGATTKRPSLLAQQRDSLRASLTLRNRRSFRDSFSRRTSWGTTAATTTTNTTAASLTNSSSPSPSSPRQQQPRWPNLFCQDQMPAFCKPDNLLLGGSVAATPDYIQELHLQ